MDRPRLEDCDWDADEFARRVREYGQAVEAEANRKRLEEARSRAEIVAALRAEADRFDRMAETDPNNEEYCRGMAEEYRERAKREEER